MPTSRWPPRARADHPPDEGDHHHDGITQSRAPDRPPHRPPRLTAPLNDRGALAHAGAPYRRVFDSVHGWWSSPDAGPQLGQFSNFAGVLVRSTMWEPSASMTQMSSS